MGCALKKEKRATLDKGEGKCYDGSAKAIYCFTRIGGKNNEKSIILNVNPLHGMLFGTYRL